MQTDAPYCPRSHHDYQGSKIGMWLFLFTEIILFGGLFILYSAYRARYPLEFHNCGQELNTVIGVVNTFVLLTSSLTMALAVRSAQAKKSGGVGVRRDNVVACDDGVCLSHVVQAAASRAVSDQDVHSVHHGQSRTDQTHQIGDTLAKVAV